MSRACADGGMMQEPASGGIDDGVLIVTLCADAEIKAQSPLAFNFSLTNPSSPQAATAVLVEMSSDAFPRDDAFPQVRMTSPGAYMKGVLGFTDPPLVVINALSVKNVSQAVPFAGARNTITLSIASSVDELDGTIVAGYPEP